MAGYVLARPILELTAHARRLSQGDLKRHITINTGDETQTLAETFNSMADSLDQPSAIWSRRSRKSPASPSSCSSFWCAPTLYRKTSASRIAFDIHDGVIQLVIAAGYELQAAARQVGNGNSSERRRSCASWSGHAS